MNRLNLPVRTSVLIAILFCVGCDDWFNRPRENQFAATPVSRSLQPVTQPTVAPESLTQPKPIPELTKPIPEISRNRTTRSPGRRITLQEKCQSELDRQSSYPFDFRLTSLNGRTIRKGQFANRLLIVDIWATWCGPCVREVPHFIDLQDRYYQHGLSIVGINFEREGSEQANRRVVDAFARATGVNYPLALGKHSITDQIEGFRGYPTTLFIDGDGQVRLTLRGSRSLAELETFVQLLLEDESIARAEPSSPSDLPVPAKIQENPFL